jgi:hypothetical protein
VYLSVEFHVGRAEERSDDDPALFVLGEIHCRSGASLDPAYFLIQEVVSNRRGEGNEEKAEAMLVTLRCLLNFCRKSVSVVSSD